MQWITLASIFGTDDTILVLEVQQHKGSERKERGF